jgi:hypothetical protein
MDSLPFTIEGVMTSLADMEGIARLEESGLVLEFMVKDNVLGLLKTQPREVCIPFADLAEVTFKRGWFKGVLALRARRMSAIADIPGNDEGQLRLQCRRRYREAGQEFASSLSLRLIAQDLTTMVDQTRRVTESASRTALASEKAAIKPATPGKAGEVAQ